MKTVEEFPDEHFLGKRSWITDLDGNYVAGSYEWRTYSQVYEDWKSLAKAINSLELYNHVVDELQTYNLIGIYSKNNQEWVITDLAWQLTNICVVTLYDILGANSTEYIIKQWELSTVAATGDHVEDLIHVKTSWHAPFFKNIILFDNISDELQKEAEDVDLKIYKFQDLVNIGSNLETDLCDPTPNDLFTICYTSGTTGFPKGVMLSHRNMVGMWATQANSPIKFYKSDIHISYLPLAHVLERLALYVVISNGAKYGLYQGDILKLDSDILELKPTVFISVPKLFTRLYETIISGIKRLKGCSKKIVDKAIKTKLVNLHKSGTVTHWLYDMIVSYLFFTFY